MKILRISFLVTILCLAVFLIPVGAKAAGGLGASVPAGFTFTKSLYYGMSDPDVAKLKSALSAIVVLGSTTNNFFGAKTKLAVKCFQNIFKDEISEIAGYRIKATGLFGVATREFLNSEIIAAQSSGNEEDTSPTTCTPNWTCGWGQCVNGYQSQVATDSNNCGLPSSSADIACTALARTCTLSTQSSITVTSPNGGEALSTGSTQIITWFSAGTTAITNVDIALYKGGSLLQNIVSSTANDGSYSWLIPTTLAAGNDYKIRISKYGDVTIYDESNANFSITITTTSITVLSPNGGETLPTGSTQIITWTSLGTAAITNVDIALYKGGNPFQNIVSFIANDGSYSWLIPNTLAAGTNYKIRIRNSGDVTIYDESNAYFSIFITPTSTPTPALNALNVALDNTTPVSANIDYLSAIAQKDKVFTKIKLTAGSSDISVNSLTVALKYDDLMGLITNANGQSGLTLPLYNQYYLSNIKVFDGVTQLGQTIRASGSLSTANNFSSFDVVSAGYSLITGLPVKLANGTYYYATISTSLRIVANSSKTISITADVANFMQNYNLPIQLGLSEIVATNVKGTPIFGNKIFIVPPKAVLSATITTDRPRELSNQGVSGIYVDLGTFRFAAKDNDVYIQKLKLKKLGTLPNSAIKSIWLNIARTDAPMSDYQTNPITSQIVDSSGYITFQPTSQTTTGVILVSKNYYTNVTVRALVSGAVGDTIGVGIDSASAFESNADIQDTIFPLNNALITRALISSATGNTAQANPTGESSQTGGLLNIISQIGNWLKNLINK